MDTESLSEFLGSGSPEFETLKEQPEVLAGFIALIESVDKMQHMDRRIHEKGLSLYQAISREREIGDLEGVFEKFFGEPAKPAGQGAPKELQRTHTFKHFKNEFWFS